GTKTYTINGGTGTDTLEATADANFTLTNTQLTVGSTSLTLSSIEQAKLTNSGAAGHTLDASAFTAGSVTLTGGRGNGILKGGSGNDTLKGGTGDDHYVFAGTWGTDTLIENAGEGTDTLDFTALDLNTTPLTVNSSRTQISDGTNQVNQSATAAQQAEEIDITLLSGAKTKITDVLTELSNLIDKAQTDANAVTELINALPFLGSLTGGGVPNLAD